MALKLQERGIRVGFSARLHVYVYSVIVPYCCVRACRDTKQAWKRHNWLFFWLGEGVSGCGSRGEGETHFGTTHGKARSRLFSHSLGIPIMGVIWDNVVCVCYVTTIWLFMMQPDYPLGFFWAKGFWRISWRRMWLRLR
jgi:hypothetical protein